MVESDIYAALKRNLPLFSWQRIETMTHSGIPDISYCSPTGIDGWIELKIGIPRLKPSQVAWHTRSIAQYRRAFILSSVPNDGYHFYRTDKFCPIGTAHFTPAFAKSILLKTKDLKDLSPFLTASYKPDSI